MDFQLKAFMQEMVQELDRIEDELAELIANMNTELFRLKQMSERMVSHTFTAEFLQQRNLSRQNWSPSFGACRTSQSQFTPGYSVSFTVLYVGSFHSGLVGYS